jgi:membrane protease YdiL (CAAX protease family)
LPDSSPQGHNAIRLDARDARVLLLWLLAGIVGASVAYRYFFQAFPEASVNFQVTRDAALDRARAFVAAQGFSPEGYQSAIVFSVRDDDKDNQKTYLEREVGLEQANRLMSSDVSVWYWDARFFKPLQKEEFHVGVDPAGRIVGYQHTLAEEAPGARPDRAEALSKADGFLRDTLHMPLGGYTFLPTEANSSVRPNRTDWSFTWERTGFRAKDAPYRLHVTLTGDRIGGYQEGLQVPEAWQRDYERMRSGNTLVASVAGISYVLLIGGAFSVAFSLGRRGQAPWAGPLRFGLFIAALYFLMQMNQWPLLRSDYDTNSSYSSFILSQTGLAAGTALLYALLVVIALVPGEPWYRATQPARLRLGGLFRWPAFRSKEFFISGAIGVCLAAAHIGYVVLFYVIGRKFGVWAPQDLQYSDTLSTALPWIYPLTIGIYAATSEEFLFRLFAVPWVLRISRSRVLAVVLPALAWGFLHANYPQEPAYIRGVEVGAMGIVAGLVMLRWGILATLIWHYTVDSFLVGLSLMRSADFYSRISGTLVGTAAFTLVAIAGLLYLKSGTFADATEVLNRAEPLPEAAPAAPVSTAAAPAPVARYTPLSTRAVGLLAVCGVAGIALALGAKGTEIGDYVRFPVDAAQAKTRASAVLRQQGLDPDRYRQTATVEYRFDPRVNEYLHRSIGIDAANKVYQTQAPQAYWVVRYFRDSEREEYLVVLLPDGALHSVHHTLAEETPGANLTKEEAQRRAEDYLRRAKMLDLSRWTLVDAHSDKLPARTDHVFTWEQKAPVASLGSDEGAHVRVEARVQGEEASGYRVFIHLPEGWVRQHDQDTLATTAHSNGLLGLVGAFVVAVLVAFLRELKQPSVAAVPWRGIAKWSLVVPVAFVVTVFTAIPQYLASYTTETSFPNFVATRAIGLLLGSAGIYGSIFLLWGLAWFFLAGSYGAEALPRWRGMSSLYYRDGLLLGACGSAIVMGLDRAREIVGRLWPVAHYEFPASVPGGLDAVLPAVQALASSVMFSFIAIGMLALAAGFAASHLRGTWKQVALLGLLALLGAPRWGSTGELIQSFVMGWAALLLLWWAVHRIARFNLLGYFLGAALLLLVTSAVQLLRQPNLYFRANGWTLLAAAGALLLWAVRAWRRGARTVRDAGIESPISVA